MSDLTQKNAGNETKPKASVHLNRVAWIVIGVLLILTAIWMLSMMRQ